MSTNFSNIGLNDPLVNKSTTCCDEGILTTQMHPSFDLFLDKVAVHLYMFCSIVTNRVIRNGDDSLIVIINLHKFILINFNSSNNIFNQSNLQIPCAKALSSTLALLLAIIVCFLLLHITKLPHTKVISSC